MPNHGRCRYVQRTLPALMTTGRRVGGPGQEEQARADVGGVFVSTRKETRSLCSLQPAPSPCFKRVSFEETGRGAVSAGADVYCDLTYTVV